MKTTAKDLRFYSKEILDAVSRGEEVIITYRGKPCAKLVPYQEEKGPAQDDKLFGMWRDHDSVADVNGYVRQLRQGRSA